MIDDAIEKLIYILSKLPGFGKRSARRVAVHLISKKHSLMTQLVTALEDVSQNITKCSVCGNIDVINPCKICSDITRDNTLICVVEELSDLWAFERSNIFKGKYHVLGGTLSAVDSRSPSSLNMSSLIKRASSENVSEVIIATNTTIDGQTTAFYITEKLAELNVKVTRLACGMPVGGELDFLDEGTLNAALKSRSKLSLTRPEH